ncbi:class I SAM-dependent methyltransferase [Bailinhaonella thermotolerans]|uniref:class I SAM-dependent methyltransferase n=1 Tax=Bailinhaonella thermotolerans TaxID=1070861 RepID=UPI00192A296B|nr:class I SAM-dependent methyltransferase [Bailinhaonella thermotolerans]
MPEEFDEAYWEGRYREHTVSRRLEPNPYLAEAAGGLPPGAALEAGCGTGTDAVWLASRGWRVTGVDISDTALEHAREHARESGVADRIDWVRADLTGWTPAEEGFALVYSHYVHPAAGPGPLFRRLAAAVAPGGTLLIVDHHPPPAGDAGHTAHGDGHAVHTTHGDGQAGHGDGGDAAHGEHGHGGGAHGGHGHAPGAGPHGGHGDHGGHGHGSGPLVHLTPEEIAAALDPAGWEVVAAEFRTRTVTNPRGHGTVLHDSVVRARRRP